MKKISVQKHLIHLRTGPLRTLDTYQQARFEQRLQAHWEDIVRPLYLLYGQRPKFNTLLQHLLTTTAQAYVNRSAPLHELDIRRLNTPDWFQRSNMIGYVCYADRFAQNLNDIHTKIPYLQELGISYLHLMPLLQPRPAPNDGGYAVANYRQIRDDLGTMDDLATLAQALRQQNISLCIDLVCNHTAKEHEWAQQAQAGNKAYQRYYHTFSNRNLPDQYEQTTPEVFPDWAPGNFTYYDQMKRWVWTTFNEYQWDLNYSNPAVFNEMLSVILFLANQGVEILRLDAVAFMWKQLGTDSQNRPKAHAILQAFRALSRVAAPALILKAEAIVSPDDLVAYFGVGDATGKECELAYHNVFMVLLWSALAERKANLLTYALQRMPTIPANTAWCTYIRCHDDIGWAITDADAGGIGLSAHQHRSFLSDFYSGQFPHSFARGQTFQFNPKTGDRRISGSLASLAGLEKAIEEQNEHHIDLAIKRILLLYTLMLTFGGIPLLYMGDELGLLNDYTYQDNPNTAHDNRWLHRPRLDWHHAQQRQDATTIPGQLFQGIQKRIDKRKNLPLLHAQTQTDAVWIHNDHVFGLLRHGQRGRLLILANMTEHAQTIPRYRLDELGFAGRGYDHLTETRLPSWGNITLQPYQTVWLQIV
ncbi:MAG TPA: alpha-amylase family glycosyl hydrolase [Anaerolineae bacterium]|nr:alpha-amylase family glycosyl hydrolase [Anaerolineae bacterium]